AAQIGSADDELASALDTTHDLAMKSVVAAAGTLGARGIKFLIKTAGHERSRVRVNAIDGVARFGKADVETSLAFLAGVEQNDPVPDVRTAAKQASLMVIAREKVVAVDNLPKNIPDFEERKLSASELREHEAQIKIDEMIYALQDGRAHVKINAARALALAGERAAGAATAMGVNLRDSVAAVRKETAKALGKLGTGALPAGKDLVGALGDADEEVAEAASDTLAELSDAAIDLLIAGLDAGTETHGLRVGALIAKLPKAQVLLTDAFTKSPAVNVQVNAALALMQIGPKVTGAALAALHGARTGGDARTRDAVRRALDQIEPKGMAGPQNVTVEGFEERFLDAKDLEKAKPDLEKIGAADLSAHLTDGRDVVRANAATALGVLGSAAAGTASMLGVKLRDDAPRVRLACAQALDRIGDEAVVETSNDLVGALRDAEEKNAEAVGTILRARKGKVVGALIKGLETDDARHARRVCEVINALPDAVEILTDSFTSPAVNVQVNSALGLGMLGKDKVGKGKKVLEGARTGGDARTREAVRAALDLIEGAKETGPKAISVDGFETKYLEAAAFGDGSKLPANDLVGYLQDGRGVVRANAATALGAMGPAVAGAATSLGVLLRDDDMKVRIAAAQALDKLGDDAVKEVGAFLVGALRGDADVAKAVAPVLTARKAKVLTALLKGLETDDPAHAGRILDVINALSDACEILIDAFDSPAENVQVNAAIGIGMLGAKRAGKDGQKKLEGARTGGFARTREAVFKALAMLKG
ncbi:MAG TPA: HEAT repeat domain-containing protein, partial [Kofleriaceae bacterium]